MKTFGKKFLDNIKNIPITELKNFIRNFSNKKIKGALKMNQSKNNIVNLFTENNNVKFLYNGIKLNGILYKCYYSKGNLIDKYPKETISIYGKHYIPFPRILGLQIINESDSLSDYYEDDKIRVLPDNIYYNKVLEAYNKYEDHRTKIKNKRIKGA